MQRTQIRDLVHATLQPKYKEPGMLDDVEFHLKTFDDAAGLGVEAVSGSGTGLDLHGGERVLAGLLHRDTPKGHEHRLCTVITDRRTFVSGYSSTSGGFNDRHQVIEHAHLAKVEIKDGILETAINLYTAHGKCQLPYEPVLKPLGHFYQSLMQLPQSARVVPPTPFFEATAEDPTGIDGALASMWQQDPEASGMLQGIRQNHQTGHFDDATAVDLAKRIVLAHRGRMGGLASSHNAWLCPLSSGDMIGVLMGSLGYPVAQQPSPQGHVLDFRIDPKKRTFVTAGDVAGVAAYAVVGVGFSPTSVIGGAIAQQIMKREQVTSLRITCGDTTCASWFQVLANGHRPLAMVDSMLGLSLHQYLLHHSYPVLGRRAMKGWGVPFEQLFS
jgi:hypothetical protein